MQAIRFHSLGDSTRLRTLRIPAALCLALFIVSFNLFTMVTLIAPVVRGFGTTVGTVQIVLVLLSLVTAAYVPMSTDLAAMHGDRRLVTLGLLLFILAALVTASSPTVLALLLGFSILGGLAAAPLVTLPWVLMERRYTGRQRDIALMALANSIALGAAAAPPLAGFIADASSWRWAFVPQVAVAAAILPLIRPLVDHPRKPKEPIDWLGGWLALLGSGAVLSGLSLAAEYGWWEPRKLFLILGVWTQPFALSVAPVLMMAGAVVLGCWLLERRGRFGRARARPLRAGVLRHPRFMAGALTAALHGLAISGLMFALFVYIPFAFRLKGLATAIAVLPFSLASLVGVALSPQLARWLVPKYVVQSGLLVCTAGLWLLLGGVSTEATPSDLLSGLIALGAGSGLVWGQIANLTLSLPGAGATGQSSGIYNSLQDLGGSLGRAILGAVLMVGAATQIVQGVVDTAVLTVTPEQQPEIVYELSQRLQTMRPEERQRTVARLSPEVERALESVVPRAVVDAMRATLLAIGGTLGLALIASLCLPPTRAASA
jgi:MFS family permease